MRFVPDGPDIPNELIKEWRTGRVLFLAGAGVSVPSRLPLFEGLALKVYESLHDALFNTLAEGKRRRLGPTGFKALLDAAVLSPDRRVEATLFLERQFDRLFSALEKRIDPDIKGRKKTRNVRKAIEAILGGTSYSESHRDLLRLSISPNSSGDPAKPLSCRIVTTNFDLLFEAAWRAEYSFEPTTFDARMAPRPGAHNFDGIIHLHGMLVVDPALASDYILSSRDFARVYLRSGVIGNYVYDLIRRYRLVLVGYSADDPPMRYLMDAIGEDASLFDDMYKPYAITDLVCDLSNPTAAIEEAVWQAKEITPIFFKRRRGRSPFAPLWESLRQWANWARDDLAWIEGTLEANTSGRRADASPFQRALVQDIFSVLSPDELANAFRFLNKLRVDFGWVETVDAAIKANASADRGAR